MTTQQLNIRVEPFVSGIPFAALRRAWKAADDHLEGNDIYFADAHAEYVRQIAEGATTDTAVGGAVMWCQAERAANAAFGDFGPARVVLGVE